MQKQRAHISYIFRIYFAARSSLHIELFNTFFFVDISSHRILTSHKLRSKVNPCKPIIVGNFLEFIDE